MVRKVKWLLAIVVAVCVIWSGLWYAASIATAEVLDRVENRTANAGHPVTCSDRQISGYPFHMTVSCVDAELASSNTNAIVQSVRSVALLYKPGHVIAEADGPLRVNLPTSKWLSGELNTSWESARASVSAGVSGLKRISVVGKEIALNFDVGATQNFLQELNLDDAQLHIRPNADVPSHFDIAANASELVAKRGGRDLPSMRISLLAKALDVGDALDFDPEQLFNAWLNSGGSLEIEAATFDSLGFAAKASGPLSVSNDGLLSGQVKLEISGIEKLPDLVSEIAPRFKQNAEQMATTLQGFSSSNPDGSIVIPLLIRNGIVSAGILPIGKIPSMF